jgi:hypothetical protein
MTSNLASDSQESLTIDEQCHYTTGYDQTQMGLSGDFAMICKKVIIAYECSNSLPSLLKPIPCFGKKFEFSQQYPA